MSDAPPPERDRLMKEHWNLRAKENARYYIATTQWETEEEFEASGARDVRLFFHGVEPLLHPRAVVLDIGCGIGRMDRYVAPRVGRLIALDVSGEMLARARARLAHLPNVSFVEGDGRTLRPIADASIDLVFSHIVFQHLPRDVTGSYFREVARVLRPGGSFLFQVPEALGPAPPDPPPEDTFELRTWREEELRALLERLGFVWRACPRYRIDAPVPTIDQLRPHLVKPV